MTPKKILIMGATSGIGLHVAETLADRGWTVGAAGRNTRVLEELRSLHPGQILTAQIDITHPDAPKELHRLAARMGGMDIYFHVAGIGYDNEELGEAEEMAVMETNALGFTRMIDAAWHWFVGENGGYGQIAAITSVAGTNGIGQIASYSATKAMQQNYLRGLDQLSRERHLHLCFTDIRPGWVRTPLLDDDRNYPMCMQLPYATRRIVRALERRRRVAVIDWRWNLLVGLWRLVPNAVWVRLPIRIASLASPRQTRRNAGEAVEQQEGVKL